LSSHDRPIGRQNWLDERGYLAFGSAGFDQICLDEGDEVYGDGAPNSSKSAPIAIKLNYNSGDVAVFNPGACLL
jgi:hypothetical protein